MLRCARFTGSINTSNLKGCWSNRDRYRLITRFRTQFSHLNAHALTLAALSQDTSLPFSVFKLFSSSLQRMTSHIQVRWMPCLQRMFWVAFATQRPHKKGPNFIGKLLVKGRFLCSAWAKAVLLDGIGSVSEGFDVFILQ